jgi:undecaprenyl-diphosphatase
MLEFLQETDKDLLIFFNSCHSPFWDNLMLKVTERFFWIPLYLLIILFIGWRYRKDSIIIIFMISIMIISSELITSFFMKPYFERLRPCHDESIKYLLRIIDGCGGEYGFASSHASNTFSFAVFMILLLRKDSRWIYILLLWASLVSYSRVYLAVHYPGDIITGGVIGVFLGVVFFNLYIWSDKKLKYALSS